MMPTVEMLVVTSGGICYFYHAAPSSDHHLEITFAFDLRVGDGEVVGFAVGKSTHFKGIQTIATYI